MAVTLDELLDERHVALDLRSLTFRAALEEIVHLLHASGAVEAEDAFLEQVLEREKTLPTVLEHGVALPHARTDLVDKILLGIGRSRLGVRPSGSTVQVQLIFLIGVPQQLISEYLVCVGALARLSSNADLHERLMTAPSSSEFVALLRDAYKTLE